MKLLNLINIQATSILEAFVCVCVCAFFSTQSDALVAGAVLQQKKSSLQFCCGSAKETLSVEAQRGNFIL